MRDTGCGMAQGRLIAGLHLLAPGREETKRGNVSLLNSVRPRISLLPLARPFAKH